MVLDTDFNANYVNTDNTPAILSSVQSSMHDTNGLLTPSALTQIIASLKTANVLPTLSDKVKDETTKNQYEQAITTFIENGRKEYYFYNDKYNEALTKLFSNIRSGYSNAGVDNKAAINKYLEYATKLNIKLTDLVQIFKDASDDMIASSDEMQAKITQLNTDASAKKDQLNYQGNIIRSSQSVTKINKEMMKYTEEKGRYTDNLLKMYSFLNIVAFGLLIYIYRAAN